MQIDTLKYSPLSSNQLDTICEYLTDQKDSLYKITDVIEKASSTDKLFDLVTYDTVFIVVVTLAIFILGIIINWFLKYLDKKSEQKELRKYFKTYLDKIIDKTCTKLSEMYKEFYQDNNIDSGIPTRPPKLLTGDFERIHNIEDKDLFSSIKEKESLSKLLSNLDFVEKLIFEIDKIHEHHRKESDFLRTPLQEMINEYFDLLSHYVEHVRVDQPNYQHCNDFRNLINESILKYHKEFARTRQLKKLYREIIRPIQEMVVETNIFRIDSIGFKIADLGKKISYQYNYLKRLIIDFKLDYRKFHKYVDNSQCELKKEQNKITWG